MQGGLWSLAAQHNMSQHGWAWLLLDSHACVLLCQAVGKIVNPCVCPTRPPARKACPQG